MSYYSQRAHQQGLAAGRRAASGGIDDARARWLKRHAGEHRLLDCVLDWEDGFRDGEGKAMKNRSADGDEEDERLGVAS